MKLLRLLLFLLCTLLFSCNFGSTSSDRTKKLPETRFHLNLNQDWIFTYDPSEIIDTTLITGPFQDSSWVAIAIPHTWSTYETTGDVHPFIAAPSERDDPYWFNGWGYYKKKIKIGKNLKGKLLSLEFDGVQKYCRIYLNGQFIGDHKGGYNSFYFPISDYIRYGQENVLSLAVSNKPSDPFRIGPMSAGNFDVYGGIYRDVRLRIKNPINIPYQGSYMHEGGTFITTPSVTTDSAKVAIRTYVQNRTGKQAQIKLKTEILAPNGHSIKKSWTDVTIEGDTLIGIDQKIRKIKSPQLWSVDHPNLYTAISRVMVKGKQVDSLVTSFGIRYFHWDYANNDLYLNGKKINIKGSNRHQEYPYVGDAIPKSWTKYDLEDLKVNLGHNFMRYAHYPNDPYVYDLSDSLGIMVVEEVPNIKNLDFSEKVQKQNVIEMIRRDRNHPSILFWSMGNETNDAADSKWAVAEDTTRIIHLRKGENGGDYIDHNSDNLDLEQLLRVTVRGWENKADVPKGIVPAPENGQWAGTEKWQHDMAMVRGGSVRGILGDNCVTWLYNDHGADREYKQAPLLHTNPKGWVDYFRYPKYIYYLTKALYTDKPTVHIQPDPWRPEFLGQRKTITVNSNCDSLALYSGQRKIGIQYPDSTSFYVLKFPNVEIKNQVLRAQGWKDGKSYQHKIAMTGPVRSLKLIPEKTVTSAARSTLTFVEVRGYDEDGNEVLHTSPKLNWNLTGAGKLVTPETYVSEIDSVEADYGIGYTILPIKAIIRSSGNPGNIKIEVKSPGLKGDSCSLKTIRIPQKNYTGIKQPKLKNKYAKAIEKKPNWYKRTKRLEELDKVRENVQFPAGQNLDSYRKEMRKFIMKRNPNLSPATTESEGLSIFININAKNLDRLNGLLIADDYNFLLESFFDYRNLERFLENQNLHPLYVDALKNYLANKVLRESTVMAPSDLGFLRDHNPDKFDYIEMRFTTDPNRIGNSYRRTVDKSLRVWGNNLRKALVTAFPVLKNYSEKEWVTYLSEVKKFNPFIDFDKFPDKKMMLLPIPQKIN